MLSIDVIRFQYIFLLLVQVESCPTGLLENSKKMKRRFEINAFFFTVHVARIDQICPPDLSILQKSEKTKILLLFCVFETLTTFQHEHLLHRA